MGAGLVKACYDRWSHLDDVPFRVLVYMAVTVLDADPDPTFWEGRVALAGALGRAVVDPDLSGEAAEQQRRRALKAVNRAIESLTVAGAIKLVRRPGPGRNAEYRLDLSMERYPVSGDRTVPGERGLLVAASSTSVDGTVPGEWVERYPVSDGTVPAHRVPDEYQEDQEDLTPPTHARTKLTVPRPRPAEDPNLSGGPASRRITLRVLPGTGPPSQPVVTQPALWPAAVPEEADVDAATARQVARSAIADARVRHRAALARSSPSGAAGPPAAPTETPARPTGPTCPACGTELDPDRTCFTCRGGRVQTA